MIHASLPTRRSQSSATAVRLAWTTALLVSLAAFAAHAQEPLARTPSPEGARIYIIGLEDGDKVSSPVVVRFGLAGMGVAPAGVEKQGTGHHHLIIDSEPIDYSLPVPKDDRHRHFGGGHTEVSVELPPGKHTLQLVLADHRHVPHDPPVVSKRIEITVE